jgi:hypothetical protein
MPTTRPGFIWSGTEWVAIGQEAVLAPVSYQATAPTSPATGDIWIESDVDVPSIDSAQFLRWRKTMAGGETSLSGNDDSSLPLAYTPGYEQLYINGVLQVRGGDYTATTGTTVTGLTALVANDVVEIFSAVARTVADVYTQTQSDARFVNKNVGGLNLVVPTSVSVGSGTGTVSANGLVTFTGASSVAIDGCFTSTYTDYKGVLNISTSTATANHTLAYRTGGVTNNTANYFYGATAIVFGSATVQGSQQASATSIAEGSRADSGAPSFTTYNFGAPQAVSKTNSQAFTTDTSVTRQVGTLFNATTQFDGFILTPTSGTITGTIRIYGYNNGA